MINRRVVVADTAYDLVALVADKFLVRARKTLRRTGAFRVVLAGGTIARDVLEAVARHPMASELDWGGVEVWWGDERFVAWDSPDRNDTPAIVSLLEPMGVPAHQIHRVSGPEGGVDVEAAAEEYAREVRGAAAEGEDWPEFDLAFAGMGPDGHVLSVFPGSAQAQLTAPDVVAVRHSPKPPPERVTMTTALLNRAKRIWLVVSGADKAAGLALALADANPREVPVSALAGTISTKIFTDQALAQLLPAELVARETFFSAEDERADYVPKALR